MKRLNLIILCLLFSISAICIAEPKKQSFMTYDETVSFNRSTLKGIDISNKKLYVIGHKHPDSDTVISAIGYANLLKELGYDAVACISDKPNKETEYILKECGIATPELLTDAAGKNIVAVDHSEIPLAIDNIDKADVNMIIEHHGNGTLTSKGLIFYQARPIGATCSIVAFAYNEFGIKMTKEMAKILLMGIISDTDNLTKATVTDSDRLIFNKLKKIAKVSDANVAKYWSDMQVALSSRDGMTDEDIFLSDYKEYETDGFKYAIGCIDLAERENVDDMVARMKKIIDEKMASGNMDFMMASIKDEAADSNYLIVFENEKSKGICAKAFADAKFDGTCYVYTPKASRKSVLVPNIKKAISER